MITLPYEYKSGKTLLAELTPEHYITDKKKVVAKLTADNRWVKPVVEIEPTGGLILLEDEYEELTADWKRYQEFLAGVQKHRQGMHDQSTHAGKKSYKSIDDLVKDGLDIQAAVDSLQGDVVESGNVAMRVLLERMGKGGTPEIVGSIEELDGEPIYRGADTRFNRNLKEGEFGRIGFGQYGDGNYFSNVRETAQEYAEFSNNPMRGGKGDVITAGWKKDAKVFQLSLEFGDENNWMRLSSRAGKEATDKLKIASGASDSEDAIYNLFYNDSGNSLVTKLILEGYDGMVGDIGRSDVQESYTIVFNREALQVVGG